MNQKTHNRPELYKRVAARVDEVRDLERHYPKCDNCGEEITGRLFKFATLGRAFVYCGVACRDCGTRGAR